MKKQRKTLLLSPILFILFGTHLIISCPCAASEDFPLYPCIKPNVEFWKKVYTHYTTAQGIIHDRKNLEMIYEVIVLEKRESPGAEKINNERIQRAKERYRLLLKELASDSPSHSEEAKRVAALFPQKPDRSVLQMAIQNIRCQKGQSDRFREGLIRSGACIDEIRRIFRSYDLPVDLVYLPHVESSFNPEAYSRFGAAGIWQFTHSTGKRFLAVGYALDERRDPIRSSHAAAQLLKENHQKLGNWPMAITAYNHGTNGMIQAKNAKGSYEAIFQEYESRLFKFASRNFYPEFLAAVEVAKNYPEYFGKLPLEKPMETREVVLKGYVSMADIARLFKVEISTLKNLNPALRKPIYQGQKYVPKGYVLRLPSGQGAERITKPEGELPHEIYKDSQKPSRFHTVRKGDTAGKIAQIHGIALADLIMANNLDSEATIYAGQNLLLPAKDEKLDRVASLMGPLKPSGITVTKLQPSVGQAAKATSPLPVNPGVLTSNLLVEKLVQQEGKPIGIIRVEAEETLGHYAEWLNVPHKQIMRLNGLRHSKILRINQQIKLPFDRVSKEQFEEKRFEYHKEIEEDFFDSYSVESVRRYRIEEGDNIWKLCNEQFEVPFWLLKKYNPEVDFYELQPSQELIIPLVTIGVRSK
ncbi:MAG: LysM peptidoglycan-binding domain-containing protein [Pseudomonadota bacterium]